MTRPRSRVISVAILASLIGFASADSPPTSSRPEPLAAMRAAMARGDLDEAARHGSIAGPAVLASALASTERPLQLAAIVAAPATVDRHELLPALARVAAGADRRTAIPAARAAREIANELARRDLPDDVATEDLAAWRAPWAALATRTDRWIEVRVFALDTAAALDPGGAGIDLAAALADPDPHFRRAAASVVPTPIPSQMRGVLANTIARDTDEATALLAAHVLCFEIEGPASAKPALEALGEEGLARLRKLVGTNGDPAAIRDAARCLAADKSPASAAALRTIKKRPRF